MQRRYCSLLYLINDNTTSQFAREVDGMLNQEKLRNDLLSFGTSLIRCDHYTTQRETPLSLPSM